MRRNDWHDRLWETVDAHRGTAFDWAHANCCQFAIAVADAMTDGDVSAEVASICSSEEAVARHLEETGGLVNALARLYGEPDNVRPQRGDLVVLESSIGPAAGVWVGNVALVMTKVGLTEYPRSSIIAQWSI